MNSVGAPDRDLIPMLADYLPHQRWFSAKGQELGDITIVRRTTVAEDFYDADVEQVLLTVGTATGLQRYQIWIGWIWPVLKISIPIPLIALLAAFVWWQVDKTSAVRQAVDKAIDHYTHVTELAAANAEIEELKRQKLAGDAAQAWLQVQIAARNVADAAADQLNEQKDAKYAQQIKAAGRGCTLDDADIDGMRND